MENKHSKRIESLISIPAVKRLNTLFKNNEKELYLVGGSVRDALMGVDQTDLDFTTSAKPAETESIVKKFADNIWTTGAPYGTIAIRKGDYTIEITTYRKDVYRPESRNPEVTYSETLKEDLVRRDFTINAMAVDLDKGTMTDYFGGINDLEERILRTPGNPDKSLEDDPLRMLRACRFVSTLAFNADKDLIEAIKRYKKRLDIISAERIREELSKLLLGVNPADGLMLMVDTGLADFVVPELPKLKLTPDPNYRHKDVLYHTYKVVNTVDNNLVSRLTALLHDIAKPQTRDLIKGEVHFYGHDVIGAKKARERLIKLRYPKKIISDVSKLIRLHLRPYNYSMGWTDSAVRRYARDAGELVDLLNDFAIADCTTANPVLAKKNLNQVKELEKRINILKEHEELLKIRPPVDGKEVMGRLKIEPGPLVGEAMDILMEATLDGKVTNKKQAFSMIDEWAKSKGIL